MEDQTHQQCHHATTPGADSRVRGGDDDGNTARTEQRRDVADVNPGDQHVEAVRHQSLPWLSAPDDGESRNPGGPATPQAEPPTGTETAGTEVVGTETAGTETAGTETAGTEVESAVAPPRLRRRDDMAQASSGEGAVGGRAGSKLLLTSAVVASATLLAVTLVSVGGMGGTRARHPSGTPGPTLSPSPDATTATPSPAASSATATPARSASASPSRAGPPTRAGRPTSAADPDGRHAAHAKATATASPSASHPAPVRGNPTGRQSSYLSADATVEPGTNPYWAQSDLDVNSTVPLSDLRVDVRVAQTGGVASTGTWTSLGDQVDVTVTDVGDAVEYVFKLKQGVTLPAGTYYFEVQYNHAQGARDSEYDAYEATAVAGGTGAMEDARGYFD